MVVRGVDDAYHTLGGDHSAVRAYPLEQTFIHYYVVPLRFGAHFYYMGENVIEAVVRGVSLGQIFFTLFEFTVFAKFLGQTGVFLLEHLVAGVQLEVSGDSVSAAPEPA